MSVDSSPISAAGQSNTEAASLRMSSRIREFIDREPPPAPIDAGANGNDSDTAGQFGIPEVDAAGFTAAALDKAIASCGGLIVRGLFSADFAAEYRAVIDRVMEACDYSVSGNPQAADREYFDPPAILQEVMAPAELANGRVFRRNSGSVLCPESPAVAERLLQIYEDMGLKEIIAEHLGEAPCVSVKKWVLRRAILPVNKAGWHQDGAFMGADIKSINMWIALTSCGGDTGAPGMDVVPRRLRHIVSSDGAQFDWSVSDSYVGSELADSPVTSPVFAPGDAFFFDHFYLHRTQYKPEFAATRYAIETWFFGNDSFPRNQIPLAW